MNSTMGPSFKVVFAEFRTYRSCEQYTVSSAWDPQKKRKRAFFFLFSAFQTDLESTSRLKFYVFFLSFLKIQFKIIPNL